MEKPRCRQSLCSSSPPSSLRMISLLSFLEPSKIFPIDYTILASNDTLTYAMAVEHVRQKCQLDDVANPIDHLKSVQGKHHCSLHSKCSHDTKDCRALKKRKQKKPLGFAGVLQDISPSSSLPSLSPSPLGEGPSLSPSPPVKANLSLSILKIKGRAFPVLNPPC